MRLTACSRAVLPGPSSFGGSGKPGLLKQDMVRLEVPSIHAAPAFTPRKMLSRNNGDVPLGDRIQRLRRNAEMLHDELRGKVRQPVIQRKALIYRRNISKNTRSLSPVFSI
jgi:hypothetical protein